MEDYDNDLEAMLAAEEAMEQEQMAMDAVGASFRFFSSHYTSSLSPHQPLCHLLKGLTSALLPTPFLLP